MGIWKDYPKYDFGISATAATVMVAALGAAQIASVLATPLPEYAAGTRNHPGGLAVVGDGGRPEVVMTPSGGLFRTPASDTLVDLPARSVVFPFGRGGDEEPRPVRAFRRRCDRFARPAAENR
ncbi:MAG: hypothetical protein ACLR1G_04770 [Alistipes indistinctus]